MIDIVSAENGLDLGIQDTQTTKAGNVLSIQLGALEYLPDFGIDLAFFVNDQFKFQNASFKSYCIQALANNGINVSSVLQSVLPLMEKYTFNLTAAESSTAMIAR